MKRKVLSMLLVLTMLLSLVPTTAVGAMAEEGVESAEILSEAAVAEQDAQSGNVSEKSGMLLELPCYVDECSEESGLSALFNGISSLLSENGGSLGAEGMWTVNTTAYSTFAEALAAAGNGDTILLTKSGTDAVVVPENRTVIIDLNGNVLTAAEGDSAIVNNGTLTIQDTSSATHKWVADGNGLWSMNDEATENYYTTTGGVITGGNVQADGTKHGGGICNNGNLTLTGGNIVGNCVTAGVQNSATGGGVHNGYTGEFTMSGGLIAGNLVCGDTQSEGDNIGGGVYNCGGEFTLSGGEISYNTAVGPGENDIESCYGFGGGVSNSGTFTMTEGTIKNNSAKQGGGVESDHGSITVSGGSITGNTAYFASGIMCPRLYGKTAMFTGGTVSGNNTTVYGAVLVASNNTTIGGSFTITGNTTSYSGADLYLMNAITVTVQENFTGSCNIRLFSGRGVFSANAVAAVTGFTSDLSAYLIRKTAENKLAVGLYGITIAETENGTVRAGRSEGKGGETVSLTVRSDSGYRLKSITVKDSVGTEITVSNNSFTLPAADVTVTAEFEQIPVAKIAGGEAVYYTLQSAIDAAWKNDTVQLIANVREDVVIAAEDVLTLNLGGFTLTGKGSNSVVTNNGTLTVTDSVGTGKITGGSTAENGGGICNNGTLTLTGGTITGNEAAKGGGVYNGGSLTIGDTAKITGNTKSGGKEANNLYLPTGNTVTVKPGFNGSVGVITETEPTEANTVAVTDECDGDYSAKFSSDVGYAVKYSSSVLKLNAVMTPVEYLYPVYNEGDATKGIASWETGEIGGANTVDQYTLINTGSTSAVTWGTTGETSWYVISGGTAEAPLSFAGITIAGEVNIILKDGCHLKTTGATKCAGIIVNGEGNKLNIYAQSTGDNMGVLTATGGYGGAGIGGGNESSGSYITINGGTVTATGVGGGAGIGGGYFGSGENITINGGTVTTTSRDSGVGIGGGDGGSGSGIYVGTGLLIYAGDDENPSDVVCADRESTTDIANNTDFKQRYVTIKTSVQYLYPKYNTEGEPKTGIKQWNTGNCTGAYTLITSGSESAVTWGTADETSWYVISGGTAEAPLSFAGITIAGEVNIILKDGCHMTTTGAYYHAGITVSGEGNKLNIYAQSTGDNMGVLTATGGDGGAGIGGNHNQIGNIVGENITINGGTVTATGGYTGAGIGGGYKGAGNNITINGGTVTATGENYGAGIGGGQGGSGSYITVNGGAVTATGDQYGAGIGGGSYNSGSDITINDGTVTATGGYTGAGIGGGGTDNNKTNGGNGENITINGGTVTATGGQYGAGIGGGKNEAGSDITINDGTVTATGGQYGAGIGGGQSGAGVGIIINGGKVIAKGYNYNGQVSPGIGGGYGGSGSGIIVAKTDSYGTELMIYAGDSEDQKAEICKSRTSNENISSDFEGKLYVKITSEIDEVTYLYPVYNTESKPSDGIASWEKGAIGADNTVGKYTTITSGSESAVTWGETDKTSWYVISGGTAEAPLSFAGITIAGEVNIILKDGCHLTTTGAKQCAGITVSGDGNKLNVYAQSTGDNMGVLTATGGVFGAGIGGGFQGSGENITINGGMVTATGGENGAGIGGGDGTNDIGGDGSNITINGGKVTAKGNYSAGIGGGLDGDGSNITINGGTINAIGGVGGSAIGGGCSKGIGSNITINDGTVTAKGGKYGAGIGGGNSGNGSNITIKGGTVTATGGDSGAGIGGGYNCTGSDIYVATTDSNGIEILICAGNSENPSNVVCTDRDSSTDITEIEDYTNFNKQYVTIKTSPQYLYPEYNEGETKKGIKQWNTGNYTDGYTLITSGSDSTITWGEAGKTSWYVISGGTAEAPLSFAGITIEGEVNIILADGCHLTTNGADECAGITVNGDNKMTVYAQSTGDSMGVLTATGNIECAGIGGNRWENGSNITINGGTITATGVSAAGIGGGTEGDGSNITINGGTVTATGGGSSAGIGGGYRGTGSYITINGGMVNANGGSSGAGIGGGYRGAGSYVTINGGTVTATGGESGAGIGGGFQSSGSNITINGGTVTATGGANSAGIGGGTQSFGSDITINGGTVTANGGSAGSAGIGGGNGSYAGNIYVAEKDTNIIELLIYAGDDEDHKDNVCKERTSATDIATDPDFNGKQYVIITTENIKTVYDEVTYLYPVYNTKNKPSDGIASWEEGAIGAENTIRKYTLITSGRTSAVTWGKTGKTSWYVISGGTTNTPISFAGITIAGEVNIILKEGCHLTTTGTEGCAGITVSDDGSKLTVYAQSTDDNMGVLTVTGGYYGAGIGGGYYGAGENITINGGTVTATGGANGAGIGGGSDGTGSGITINGGTVTATGGDGGAGIGGGFESTGSYITINGGTVTATGGESGAGIGGGGNCTGSDITINGGTVTAKGGTGGAGIGGGFESTGSYITINGGTVTATGGTGGAGIGGGDSSSGKNITVNGGTVTAKGGEYGAGIGGGFRGSGINITVAVAVADGMSYVIKAGADESGAVVVCSDRTSATDISNTLTGQYVHISVNTEAVAEFSYRYADTSGEKLVWNTGKIGGTGNTVSRFNYITKGGDESVTWGKTGETSWYVVDGSAEYTKGITLSGDVRIIITDGSSLTATAEADSGTAGICVPQSASLTLYGQNGGNGALIATGAANAFSGGGAGIGGNSAGTCGSITIHGCGVTATGKGGGAGIGGGTFGSGATSVTILGGTVTAKSLGFGGTGIGIGNEGTAGGSVTVQQYLTVKSGADEVSSTEITNNGGDLSQFLNGNKYAGVGIGYLTPVYNDESAVTRGIKQWNTELVPAGFTTVTSSDTEWKADDTNNGFFVVNDEILFSDSENPKSITVSGNVKLILIDGSKLSIVGESGKAGIIVSGEGNSLTVYAQSTDESTMGALNVQGGSDSAGIGGGYGQSGENVTVNGGIVNATGADYAAGIGGSNGKAGNNITINEGVVTATGGINAAGIGGGSDGTGNNITINGGTVNVKGGTAAMAAQDALSIMGMFIFGANEPYVSGTTNTLTNKTDTEYVTLIKAGYEVELMSDYVSGKALVLVYSDLDTNAGHFNYNGVPMTAIDNSNAGTKYTFSSANGVKHATESSGKYVYAIIVDNSADVKLTASGIDALVTYEGGVAETVLSFAGSALYDVNGTGKTDLNDAVAAQAVYNVHSAYFGANINSYMSALLKADVNRSKSVDTADVVAILANYTK